MSKRSTTVWLATSACLVFACTLLLRISPGHFRVRRVRVTEIVDPSGRRLADPFQGIPVHVRDDLKKIMQVDALTRATACGGDTKPGAWEKLAGLLGPTRVQADQYCPPYPCTGKYYEYADGPCSGNCTGTFRSTIYDPAADHPEQGFQMIGKDAGSAGFSKVAGSTGSCGACASQICGNGSCVGCTGDNDLNCGGPGFPCNEGCCGAQQCMIGSFPPFNLACHHDTDCAPYYCNLAAHCCVECKTTQERRSEEHTSELQSL